MFLPENVQFCISRLEHAGFACYAVGGCVRDATAGLTPHDYDLCTDATPQQIKDVFSDFPQFHAGEKHGTISVVFPRGQVYEITTFRTDGPYGDSRHPDRVQFVRNLTDDLARRDFTVNAMAYSPTRGFADPFGGRQDLENGVLRAVGDPYRRFSEDALRILRGARFCVTYGFTPEETTLRAMFELAPTMEKLARERVFSELCKLIVRLNADQGALFAPILTQVIPELSPLIGFDQKNPHHRYDIYTHTMHVVEGVGQDLALRWAALLHDIGKPACFSVDENGIGHFYGHAQRSAQIASAVLRRLKAPNELREQVCTLVELHMTTTEPTRKSVRRRLSRLGYERFALLIDLQEADMGNKGTGAGEDPTIYDNLRAVAAAIQAENACLTIRDLAVDGRDLIALGYAGRQIGETLQTLLSAVLDERVENEREALLALAERK